MKRIALFALALLSSPLSAQDLTPLRIGEARPGTLTSDARHTYTVELGDSTYVFGFVNQIAVDVVVTILGPDEEEVAEFDRPARGPENFTFTSEAAGTYVIAVTPFEEQEGAYEILLINSATSNLIREGKTYQIPSVMQTQKSMGNRTLNDSLFELVKKRLVDPKEAYIKAVDKVGLLALYERANIEFELEEEI